MKARNLAAAALLALGASLAVPASATLSTGNLAQDVQSALGSSGSVNVFLEDGVVTLTGNLGSAQDAASVRQAALSFEGVERVVDLTTHE